MSTGDGVTDLFVLMLFLTGFLGVLVIPAAILEWWLGPEKPR